MLLAQLLRSLLQPQGGEKGEQTGTWGGCLIASLLIRVQIGVVILEP